MMLYLDKLLTQLAYPLGLAIFLGVLALVFLYAGRARVATVSLTAGILWLALWSMPVVSDRLRLSLEGRHPQEAVDALTPLEGIVVLGGGLNAGPPGWVYPDLGSASDRFWHAARIYHAGKAPLIVVSGGVVQWSKGRRPEAEAVRDFLMALGVPEQAIRLESRSRNTRENALYTAELLQEEGIERVFLVTSALHMPRALATFRAAGLDPVAAATDFEVMPEPAHLLRWLPDATALSDSSRALKEYLGWWVYRWRGWALVGQ